MNIKLLKLLSKNARYSKAELATMLGIDELTVKEEMEEMQKNGLIRGYKAVIDWEKTDREYVTAMIDVKLSPQRDRGFDKVAEKIFNYPEVKSVYLMSGAYDLSVLIEGKTMKEVAYFVAQKLAPIESIISTATHFVLHKYKDKGIVYGYSEIDERGNCN